MSVRWIDYVIKESPYSGAAFTVHLMLAEHADKNTGECYPKQETLAAEARVSLSSVERAIKQMCDDGYLIHRKSGYRHYYRLVISNNRPSSNPSPRRVEPVTMTGDNPSPRRVEPVTMTGAYRTVSEPSGEPSVEPTTPGLRPGGGSMKPIGDPDGRAEMPEEGSRPKPKPKFEQAPREGTHGWVVYRFDQERSRAKVGSPRYNRGHLNRLLRSLRDDDGMTNMEIEVLVRTFFVRHGPTIRTKAREIDLVSLFAQMVPQLQQQAKDVITNVRTGRETAGSRSKQEITDLMSRMGIEGEH